MQIRSALEVNDFKFKGVLPLAHKIGLSKFVRGILIPVSDIFLCCGFSFASQALRVRPSSCCAEAILVELEGAGAKCRVSDKDLSLQTGLSYIS